MATDEPLSRKAQQAHDTRVALVEAARELFGERGYADVGTEEIVRRARVTRGALYHHFADKRELFAAVVEQVEVELVQGIVAAVPPDAGPLGLLEHGTDAYLSYCLDPAVRRILLIDGPSVLGWEQFVAITEPYGLTLVRAALQGAIEARAIEQVPVDATAALMVGALTQGAMVVARADDPDRARAEVSESVRRLIGGLAPR